MTPDERIAELEAENARQREQIAALVERVGERVGERVRERVRELEARITNASKDSHTGHKPPSSDPLGRKRPRSQRRHSGKKPGGQLGHRGETLPLVATPDEVVEHRSAVYRGCQTPLDDAAAVLLYDETYDGIEGTELGETMGITHLPFAEWFERLGPPASSTYTEVHPYAQQDVNGASEAPAE